MANNRKSRADPAELKLLGEVDSTCPLCGKNLYRKKGKKTFKAYEVAHIYPLNPKSEELIELENVELLSDDPNHLNNLIPLCTGCHHQFDNPRTREEYENLVAIKKKLIEKEEQRKVFTEYSINDIDLILDSLYRDEVNQLGPSTYDLKKIEGKFDDTLETVAKQKIRFNVSLYFGYIRKQLGILEEANPNVSTIMALQVRTFYIKQKSMTQSQQEIFQNTAQWLVEKAKPKSIESAEIVVSYYIQSCEVFE